MKRALSSFLSLPIQDIHYVYKVYTPKILIDGLSRACRNTIVMWIYRIKDSPKFLSRGRHATFVEPERTTTNNIACV